MMPYIQDFTGAKEIAVLIFLFCVLSHFLNCLLLPTTLMTSVRFPGISVAFPIPGILVDFPFPRIFEYMEYFRCDSLEIDYKI